MTDYQLYKQAVHKIAILEAEVERWKMVAAQDAELARGAVTALDMARMENSELRAELTRMAGLVEAVG